MTRRVYSRRGMTRFWKAISTLRSWIAHNDGRRQNDLLPVLQEAVCGAAFASVANLVGAANLLASAAIAYTRHDIGRLDSLMALAAAKSARIAPRVLQ